VVTALTLSWVTAGATVTDWVAWSHIGVVLVVHIDRAVITLPVLIAATLAGLITMRMALTWGLVVVVVPKVTEVTVVPVHTVAVSIGVLVRILVTGVALIVRWSVALVATVA
jgi:hypothetical protein